MIKEKAIGVKNQMIKLVIFDLDGTIFDAYEAVWKSLNYAFAQFGYPLITLAQVKRSVGHGERNLLAHFVAEKDIESVQKVYREYGAERFLDSVTLLPHAKETLLWLKAQGIRTGVASNRPGWSARMVLGVLKIADLFDQIVCGDEVLQMKPNPEAIFKILSAVKIDPGETVFVGDMDLDIQTGKNAGVKTFAVATGSSFKEELAEAKPDYLAEGLSELKQYIIA
ncbi:MAG: HAD family hydrolase [Candidatus Omnitrophica bacterium]|nr:HAD family hydrolase [Candidatus Omnitrophota bacterium]